MIERSSHLVWQVRAIALEKALGDRELNPRDMIALTLETLVTEDKDLAINALSAAVDLGRLVCERRGKGRTQSQVWRVRTEDDASSTHHLPKACSASTV